MNENITEDIQNSLLITLTMYIYIYIDWISINRRLIMDIFPPWVPSFRKRIAGHRGFKDGHHPEARSTDQVAEQGRAKGWPVDP